MDPRPSSAIAGGGGGLLGAVGGHGAPRGGVPGRLDNGSALPTLAGGSGVLHESVSARPTHGEAGGRS